MKTKFFFIETYTDRLCTCKREIWGALEDWMHLGHWGWKHLKGKITVASLLYFIYQWYYRAWLMTLRQRRISVWLMRSDGRSFQRSPSIWKHISVSHTGSVCPPGRSLAVTSSSTLINAVLVWVKHRNSLIKCILKNALPQELSLALRTNVQTTIIYHQSNTHRCGFTNVVKLGNLHFVGIGRRQLGAK